MKSVKIVATIGPASKDLETIQKMAQNNLGVVRLNFSWGTYAEHAGYIATVRQVANEMNISIPIVQDLSGPRVQATDGHEFKHGSTDVLTEKDIRDLHFGQEQKVDYVAMSYVGSASDIQILRNLMQQNGYVVPIIAKIERAVAIEKIDEIIESADAIMVARGDMGNEVPLEQIPFVEKELIAKCKTAGKPVIVATQMMLSMTENENPTRAEVTDVAYAVFCGADAVMLSEESAQGKHPVESVAMMNRIIIESEKHTKLFDGVNGF